MEVYISSTQVDLAEHRVAVAKALRQTGHKVLHMEEYTAEETRPLERCVKDVASADLYVGIFAWRYGYVPKNYGTVPDLPSEIIPGEISITEAEYHAAKGKPRLIFLLAESAPWPPVYMDAHTSEDKGDKIKKLRAFLGERHMVSFFTTPDDLAREVMAAVRRQELSTQLELKSLQPVDAHTWMHQWLMKPGLPEPLVLFDSALLSVTDQIQAFDDETYMKVNLGVGKSWWSTRLYLLSSFLVDLTNVRLLVFVDQKERLFGVSSAMAVRAILSRRIAVIRHYEERLALDDALEDLEAELVRRGEAWEDEMEQAGGEASVKSWIRKQDLRRFLGDALIQRAVDWSEDEDSRGNRVLEVVNEVIRWPQDLVPIVRDDRFYKVVERDALTEEVASYFVNERLRGPAL